MDASHANDGRDPIRKRYGSTGQPPVVVAADTEEHGQRLTVVDGWAFVDRFSNGPNGEPFWNVATAPQPTAPDGGAS